MSLQYVLLLNWKDVFELLPIKIYWLRSSNLIISKTKKNSPICQSNEQNERTTLWENNIWFVSLDQFYKHFYEFMNLRREASL